MSRIVHVIGTGTIGEPLIGLFCQMKAQFGIDEVTFHKRSPRLEERPKIEALIRAGAKLCADIGSIAAFESLGLRVSHDEASAIERADVILDCSPVANQVRTRYEEFSSPKAFIAQGSEEGFGQPYALGVNDASFDVNNRFTQIVSCNTTAICTLLQTLGQVTVDQSGLEQARFLCLRRAADISQDDGAIASPEVSEHTDARFGTHHAYDAWRVYKTLGLDLNLFSSAVKLPGNLMHLNHFSLELAREATRDQLLDVAAKDERIALTHKRSTGMVFSFGRDHGYYGRIFNALVLSVPGLQVSEDGRTVTGFWMTPQDGNSLMSSVTASLRYLYGDELPPAMSEFPGLRFPEV